MTSGAASYVELEQFTRVLFRAAADVSLTPGAHRVAKEEYAGHMTTKIRCLHAPLRSRSALLVKAEKGNRIKQAGYAPGSSWHLRHWAGMDEERLVDQEWSANSYDENDGTLSVAGVPIATAYDPTLRLLVAPWIASGMSHSEEPAQGPH